MEKVGGKDLPADDEGSGDLPTPGDSLVPFLCGHEERTAGESTRCAMRAARWSGGDYSLARYSAIVRLNSGCWRNGESANSRRVAYAACRHTHYTAITRTRAHARDELRERTFFHYARSVYLTLALSLFFLSFAFACIYIY